MSGVAQLVYGGTFDPVHRGHRACAEQACALFEGAVLRLIPCADPPHRRRPQASAEHRARMLELAFADWPAAHVDRREMRRAGPSYTVDTLRALRAEFGSEVPMILMLGIDAAVGLPSWHETEALARLSHLLVLQRPGIDAVPPYAQLGWSEAAAPEELLQSACGRIWQTPAPVSSASSTAIRAALGEGECSPVDLDPGVAAYIVRHQLYGAHGG
ncbi:MAG: nicotinate-nucleotide adenylyltransferase [Xanthomonadales bacterium]|nr:nicotinate-nucleotide adenylyltransferase [Xanthomonadales bacterium]